MGAPNFYIGYKIGHAKYCVFFHDGVKSHPDGSEFYDLRIFKNKKDLNTFVKVLKTEDIRKNK